MQPVRHYSDPYQGLEVQLAQLKGFVRIVPPLIEADRKRRWNEIGERDGEPEVYMRVKLGQKKAGVTLTSPGRCIRLRSSQRGKPSMCIVRQLLEVCLSYNLREHPVLEKLVEDERRTCDRRFENVQRRYKDFAQIEITKLPSWQAIEHARKLRHALVHNLGLYTAEYLKTSLARRPVKEYWEFYLPGADDELVDNEAIPLDPEFGEKIIDDLLEAGKEINDSFRGGQ